MTIDNNKCENTEEPTAWKYWHESASSIIHYSKNEPFKMDGWAKEPLYTHPSNIKRLSEVEISIIYNDIRLWDHDGISGYINGRKFAQAIMDACNIPPEVK